MPGISVRQCCCWRAASEVKQRTNQNQCHNVVLWKGISDQFLFGIDFRRNNQCRSAKHFSCNRSKIHDSNSKKNGDEKREFTIWTVCISNPLGGDSTAKRGLIESNGRSVGNINNTIENESYYRLNPTRRTWRRKTRETNAI